MAERMRLAGRTAVITGAASGIGRAIAVSLARRGCNLALSDIDEPVVHPGGVATSIAENARVPAGVSEEEIARRRAKHRKLLRLPPEIAGETIVRGIERRERRILVGSDAKTISLIARLTPVSYWKLLTMRAGE